MRVPFVDLAALHAGLRAELQGAWERVVLSGRYVLGLELEAFENEFAAYCRASYCIGVGNGLDALTLLLHAMDIGAGDEVIVPSNTFIASWLAVTRVGAVPIPVEPEERSYNIDANRIEEAITPKTKAILPVDLYGQLADLESISRIAKRYGLMVVEDAAQAHGARRSAESFGAWTDGAAFSFFPTKNLGCLGDGGAVVTDDRTIADRVRMLRNYGSRIKYYNEMVGLNSRLDALQAAVLRVKLRHLDDWNEQRRSAANEYAAALAGLPNLILPERPVEETDHVWHLYVIRHTRRDDFAHDLASLGIETLVHYPLPPHMSRAYQNLGLIGTLPIAEGLASEVLSLPIGPHVGPNEIGVVIEAIRKSCSRSCKKATPRLSGTGGSHA